MTWSRDYRPDAAEDLSGDCVVMQRVPERRPPATNRPRVPIVAEVRVDGDLVIVRLDQLEFELNPDVVLPAVDLAMRISQAND